MRINLFEDGCRLRPIVGAALLLSFVIVVVAGRPANGDTLLEPKQKPNIVFILADDK